ncbi:TerC family protein [Calditerricola satsumensis]|uniref:Membrane protein n=2 Tax=Calditerricola satsumensis TaxID=373054 RepID=A0A8J3FEI7_9BACI|nr:membrane protein [Calditerricola satsumensis]
MEMGEGLALVNILLLDIVLSGDNAVVIGMACRHLPPDKRRLAVLWGCVGAVALRVALTVVAAYLLRIPLLSAFGGVMLLYLAKTLALEQEDEPEPRLDGGRSLGAAVKTIIVADFVMSLDNVLAIAGAAHGEVWLILFGLGLSIPLLMWGSTVVARWMHRRPLLVALGAAVLAYTAVDMIVHDAWVARWMGTYRHLGHQVAPFLAAALVFWLARRLRTRPNW